MHNNRSTVSLSLSASTTRQEVEALCARYGFTCVSYTDKTCVLLGRSHEEDATFVSLVPVEQPTFEGVGRVLQNFEPPTVRAVHGSSMDRMPADLAIDASDDIAAAALLGTPISLEEVDRDDTIRHGYSCWHLEKPEMRVQDLLDTTEHWWGSGAITVACAS